MSFRVDTVGHFEKEAKRLKKKFPSLKSEIHNLIGKLELNPEAGIPIWKRLLQDPPGHPLQKERKTRWC